MEDVEIENMSMEEMARTLEADYPRLYQVTNIPGNFKMVKTVSLAYPFTEEAMQAAAKEIQP